VLVRDVEAAGMAPADLVLRPTKSQALEIVTAIASAMGDDAVARAGRVAGEFVGGVLDEVLRPRGRRRPKLPRSR
jgi:hypothetical protein